MRILCVDDSKCVRHNLRKMLEVLGAEFREAPDGESAWHLLQQGERIDLLLLDWEMPRLDGLGLLQRLGKSGRHGDIPVIMLSSIADPARVVAAMHAGAKRYITKPFSSEDLLVAVVELLGIEKPAAAPGDGEEDIPPGGRTPCD